jgi:polar amino acid transport system substrate-binding protein
MNVKKLLGTCLIAGLLVGLFTTPMSLAAAKEDVLDKILRTGELRIGVPMHERWSIRNPNTGKMEGVAVDVMNFLCDQMGVKPKYVEVTWGTFPIALQKGEIDIFAGTAMYTVKRNIKVAFPHPVFWKGTGCVYGPKGKGKYKTLADINKPNVRIAVGLGSRVGQMSEVYFPKADVKRMKSGSHVELSAAVKAGQADVACFGHLNAWRLPKEVDWLAGSIEPFGEGPLAFPIAYGNPKWLNFVNSFFRWAIDSGLVYGYVAKWFPDVPEEIRDVRPFKK